MIPKIGTQSHAALGGTVRHRLTLPSNTPVINNLHCRDGNLSRHLYIWFTCKFYWVCLIYCLWATLSTIKRSIRRTRGLIEIMKNHFIF
ncbi:hypothetical protein V6N11_067983 [Hibiscus sabdariffa]|uniref:Photosystem II protein N n=1 Tax=Hibiscus sabdariffa TaxID=183260 RepID=A0ABR2SSS3_9ROSI